MTIQEKAALIQTTIDNIAKCREAVLPNHIPLQRSLAMSEAQLKIALKGSYSFELDAILNRQEYTIVRY